jgi:HNH/ENDO VII superfamily nuclease with conserved GHE residues
LKRYLFILILKGYVKNSLRFWGGVAETNYNLLKAGGTFGIAVAARVLKSNSEKSSENDAKPGNAKEKKGAGDDKKAAINKRPSGFRKKTVEKNWDDAEDGSQPDSKTCPDCGKDLKGNPHKKEKRNTDEGWDVDHQPKIKDREPKDTRKEVLDDYNEGTRLRCRSCNRSDNQ